MKLVHVSLRKNSWVYEINPVYLWKTDAFMKFIQFIYIYIKNPMGL